MGYMENKEKIQILVDKRNELKKFGKLSEDRELDCLLNRGIIINFLELADIKNEGIALNLLSILRKNLNSCEELKYEDSKLIGDHKLLEWTPLNEIVYKSTYGDVHGIVPKEENAMIVSTNNTEYKIFFDENGLLTSSDYEIILDVSSNLFKNLKIQGKFIYDEQIVLNESLVNSKSLEVLKEYSSTYTYGQAFKRVFPDMIGIERDNDVVYHFGEISSDLGYKIYKKEVSNSFGKK